MIPGELDAMYYNNFFSKKNADENPKGNLIQRVGKAIDKAGGVEGIGRTVDNVRTFFRRSDPATSPSDYQFGLKQADTALLDQQNKDKEKKEKERLMIIGGLVLGGIVIIGGILWYMNRQRQPIGNQIK
jgi:hypothetical protein